MIRKLLSTTGFQLSFFYAVASSLVASVLMWAVYFSASSMVKHQVDDFLLFETRIIQNSYSTNNKFSNNKLASIGHFLWRRNNFNEINEFNFYVYGLVPEHNEALLELLSLTKDSQRRVSRTVKMEDIERFMFPGEKNKWKGDHEVRVLYTPLDENGKHQLLVGYNLNEREDFFNEIKALFFSAIILIFIFAVIIGLWIGRHGLVRIDEVRETSENIINGDLSQRVPIKEDNDEYDRLSLVINAMLDRLESSMQSMREVTDNLAHDLRNPLNRLRHRLESISYQKLKPDVYREQLSIAISEIDNLIATFNSLLKIAQVESRVEKNQWKTINVGELILDLGDLYSAVAEEKDISLSVSTQSDIPLHADQHLLAQAITNLLDNAVKYTPEGGEITLQAVVQPELLSIIVSDNGVGIPESQYKQVLKRFTRLESARSQPGNGLGLSLVKAVADLHDAKVILNGNNPGLRVTLAFHNYEKKA